MRDSAIIYRSFYEAIKTLPKESQADIWGAICEFALNENEVELTGISSAIFTLIKPQLEANLKRFKNGKQPKNKQTISKTEAKPKQEEIKTEANNNNNVNNNNNQNDNVTDKYKFHFENDYAIDEKVCRENGFDEKQLAKAKFEFWNTKELDAEMLGKTYQDVQKHFLNWCRKNNERIKKLEQGTQQPLPPSRKTRLT